MTGASDPHPHPHGDQPVERVGPDPANAAVGMVLVHGRGARAQGILELTATIDRDDVAFVAPQAASNTWYPQSFLAPLESNEPFLSSALTRLDEILTDLETAGLDREHTILLGFSQGGCLASEYAARNASRYGGVVALSGGLIGPPETPREYDDSMVGTPVFLGCSDSDPHIPEDRVHETATVFEDLDADVTTRIYENMGHTVIPDELDYVRSLVDDVAAHGPRE